MKARIEKVGTVGRDGDGELCLRKWHMNLGNGTAIWSHDFWGRFLFCGYTIRELRKLSAAKEVE